jgi:DNA polymerase (family X)
MTDGEKKSRPAAQVDMLLDYARGFSVGIVEQLKSHCERIEVVGSVRRKKARVNDIDILCQLKQEFGTEQAFEDAVLNLCSEVYSNGKVIKSVLINGVQADFYIATPATYETLRLIRTGSAQHNIKLTSLAKRRGWKLYASGRGLVDEYGNILSATEAGILKLLLGRYVEPEERD